MTRTLVAASASLLAALVSAARVSGQDSPVLSQGIRQVVEVRAVDLDIVATKGGAPVEDLTKDEVTVKVDGKPVTVDYFARVAAGTLHGPDLATASPDLILETTRTGGEDRYLARQLLLFFDDAHLLAPERSRVIEAMRDFVTRLTPADRVSLVAYGTTTRVLVPFTASKEDLLDGLDRLAKVAPAGQHWESQYRVEVQEALRARRLSTRQAIIRSWSEQAASREKGLLQELRRSVAALGARAGKRALLFVSNGVELHPGQTFTQALGPSLEQWDRSVLDEFQAVIREANRAGVTIHALDAKGLTTDVDASSAGPNPLGSFLESQNLREALQGFADATGGVLATNRNAFAPALDRIYRESSTYYAAGITLKNLDPRVKEHRVEVATSREGVVLRTRRGVSVRAPDDAARDRMEMALMNPGATGDFPATLTLGPPRKGGGLGHRIVPWEVAVPVSALTFHEESGRRVAPLEISIAAVRDTGERSPVTTARAPATIDRKEGAPPPETWRLTGELKSGKGNVRFVVTVRDLGTDRIGIASAAVRVE